MALLSICSEKLSTSNVTRTTKKSATSNIHHDHHPETLKEKCSEHLFRVDIIEESLEKCGSGYDYNKEYSEILKLMKKKLTTEASKNVTDAKAPKKVADKIKYKKRGRTTRKPAPDSDSNDSGNFHTVNEHVSSESEPAEEENPRRQAEEESYDDEDY